jgi:diguanylate cyclase
VRLLTASSVGPDQRHGSGPDGGGSTSLRADLIDAVDHGGLALVYQPIVGLAAGEPRLVEALVRWNHSQLGVLRPDDFFHLLDDVLARRLGAWVRRTAFAQAREWIDAETASFGISVNVDPRELATAGFADDVERDAAEAGLRPEQVGLEVCQGERLPAVADEELRRLYDRGYLVILDDVGTGFNGLAAVQRLPLRMIKLDQRFAPQTGKPKAEAIISAVGVFAQKLGLPAVAEGIEAESQVRWFVDAGFELGQGFYFTPPLSAAELGRLLRAMGAAVERHLNAQELARSLAREGHSLDTIANALNSAGLRTDEGKRWHRNTVTRLLFD